MATYTDKPVTELIINQLTENQLEALQNSSDIQPNQIYVTPDDASIDVVQEQSDWNETDVDSAAYIKNKPDVAVLDDLESYVKISEEDTYTSKVYRDSGYLYLSDTDGTNTSLVTITPSQVNIVNGSNGINVTSTNISLSSAATTKNIIPSSNNTYNLGSETAKWSNIYATTFNGNVIGDLTGNADTATKLETVRSIQTNLASTASASFDGSADITPGVSGILPVANGGTGASDLSKVTVGTASKVSNGLTLQTGTSSTATATYDGSTAYTLSTYYVDKYIDQTIGGTKTFSSTIVGDISGNAATADKVNNSLTISDGTDTTLATFDGSEAVSVDLSENFMDLSSQQEAIGVKTFSAGIIVSDLTVNGNITQNGTTYETHAQEVYTTNDYIYLREGATGAIEEYSGFEIVNYDGNTTLQKNLRLVVDSSGIARVGDVGDEQPLATRVESPKDGAFAVWNAEATTFETDGDYGPNTVALKSDIPTNILDLTDNTTSSSAINWAEIANSLYVGAENTSEASHSLLFSETGLVSSSEDTIIEASNKLYFTPSTGTLSATTFSGAMEYSNTATLNAKAYVYNGSEAKSYSWYAPTSAGTSGQVLTSTGGTPGWTSQSSLTAGALSGTDSNGNAWSISAAGKFTGTYTDSSSVTHSVSADLSEIVYKLSGLSYDGSTYSM